MANGRPFAHRHHYTIGEYKANMMWYAHRVDEGRKRTLAVVTAVLLVPRLGNLAWDGRSSAASCESLLMSALGVAERIMEVIDRKYPTKSQS
jgi:hypothetical protein